MSPVAGSGTSSQTAPEVARSAQSTNASPTTPLAVKRRASSGSSTPTRRTPGAVKRGFPEGSQLLRTPANSHLFQPRLTKSREFSGRPTRGNSRSEGTRPVRSGLPPPPSSPANLDREETRAGFPSSFRGFAGVGCNTRRPGGAERAALSLPVSSLDFRGERLRRPRRQAATPQPGEHALGDGTLKAAALAADRAGIQSYLTHHQSELRSISTVDYKHS